MALLNRRVQAPQNRPAAATARPAATTSSIDNVWFTPELLAGNYMMFL